MGDTPEGSSSAAHSAQSPDTETRKGLIDRLVDVFSTADPEDEAGDGAAPDPAVNGAVAPLNLPGMANLRRMQVEDVAIPSVEITAVPNDIEKDELVQVFRESGNTRLPVYEGTLDTPLGLIHLKDFALRYGFNGSQSDPFEIAPLLRPLLYAPPSMPIGVLLQKMQSERMHMALVIDEYGGVDGLLTIEDLIEQVIGEIEDEHDIDEEAPWVEEKPGCYLALARAPLDEFEAETGIKLVDEEQEEEIDTLGGLVFMELGRIPVRGECVPHVSGAEFEVVDADPRRIRRLRVRLPVADAEA